MTIHINETTAAITLDTLDDWHEFALANKEELVEEYGSLTLAQRHLMDGGLTMGGGAAPLVFISFSDD